MADSAATPRIQFEFERYQHNRVTYRYVVDGTEFEGIEEAWRHPRQGTVTVHYSTRRPSVSVLHDPWGPLHSHLVGSLVLLVFVVAGVAVLYARARRGPWGR